MVLQQVETEADMIALGQVCPTALMNIPCGEIVLQITAADVLEDGFGGR